MVPDDLILEHIPSTVQNTVHGIFNPLSQCQRTNITRRTSKDKAVTSTGGILFLIEAIFYGQIQPDQSVFFQFATHNKPAGGAGRDRTDDLLLAKQALSQLSYGPIW